MPLTEYGGQLTAKGLRLTVVAGRWNSIFGERLVEGALDAIRRHGGSDEDTTVVRVPGCFEIPLVAQEIASSGQSDAVIAVGVLIRGETDHYELIANQLAAGLARVMQDTGVPVTFGVVTADTMDQALARSGSKAGNKGWEAAVAAIEMANLLKDLRGRLGKRS